MSDRPNFSRDLAWYQNQWEELMDVLPTSEPEEVVDQVRELQISVLDEEAEAFEEMGIADAENAKTVLQRVFERLQNLRQENQILQHLQDALDADSPDELAALIDELRERAQTLEERQKVLADAGFEHPEHAVQALTSMKQQLDELYGEKEATESIPDAGFEVDGGTFDQLQALIAREEKLQRELGVSSPDAVIEIVEGLTDQLDALYEGQERLAELNLHGTDEAIEMVQSMQKQLDSFYEQQDQMSDHGIDGVDHALSMIDSMEAQLNKLYDERHRLAQQGVETPNEIISRLEEFEEKLNALIEEKEVLRDKRARLQTQFDELEEQIAAGDPEAVTDVIDSLEAQLEEVYEEESDHDRSLVNDEPLLAEDTLAQLEHLDDDGLDELPTGVFRVDDQGTIRRANANVLQWPDVEADDSDAVLGQNFFDEVAPATKNALFQGRFQEGVDEGVMDARFFYTYVSRRDASTNLMIHLHRKADQSANWIVFRVL